MGKISKVIEQRRQQARIAAAQAQMDAAVAADHHSEPARTEPAAAPTVRPAPTAPQPAPTPAPTGRGLAGRSDTATTAPAPEPVPGAGAWGNPRPAAAQVPVWEQERQPVPSTLPNVAAREQEPAPEPRRPQKRRQLPTGRTVLAPEADAPERGGRHIGVALAVVTAALVVAVDVGIGRGAPVLGHSWEPWALASAGAAVALIAVAARALFTSKGWYPTRRQFGAALAAALLAVAAFTIGVSTSVVIDGKVMSATSDAARAYELSTMMLDDLEVLSDIDELVATDPAQAQARFREFPQQQAAAEEIANRWSRVDAAALPAGELVVAVENMKVAGFAAAKAVEAREAMIGTNNAKLAADVATLRSTYIDAALSVMPAIADTEARFGFTVLPPGGPEDLE